MNNNCSDFQQIQPCSSMNYFVEKIENSFFANTAFIDGKTIIRYSEFCENIRKCVSYFRRFERRYYNINTLSAYYFSMAYLAVVCSGNVAVLSKQPILTDPSGKIPVYKVTEKILRDAISNECPSDIFISTDTEAIATVAQSSGTTSVAKGVALSQKALLCNMHAGMTAIKFDESFRYLHVIPYYHLFGLVSNMLAPLYVGATICDSGKPLSVYSDFLKYNISATCLPPVLVTGLWNMIERYGFENITGGYLKKIICAGAPPDFSVYDGFEKIGVHIFTGYGLTECAPCVSVNGDYANKIGSCGLPVICNKVKIVDGEIAVKGDNLMLGYWEAPIETEKVIVDGWLMTGDLGYIDDDGFLFVTGRKNNLIVFENGEKLIPEQLEKELCEISEVIESMVTELRTAEKVLLNITVVSTKEKHSIESKVKQILEKAQLLSRLHIVNVTSESLEKSILGKVKRKNELMKEGNLKT